MKDHAELLLLAIWNFLFAFVLKKQSVTLSKYDKRIQDQVGLKHARKASAHIKVKIMMT